MKLYGIDDFAKMVGVTQKTCRNWDKLGELKPHHVSGSGYRYYSQTQLNELLRKTEPGQRIVVGYARVSSPKQKENWWKTLFRSLRCSTAGCKASGRTKREDAQGVDGS